MKKNRVISLLLVLVMIFITSTCSASTKDPIINKNIIYLSDKYNNINKIVESSGVSYIIQKKLIVSDISSDNIYSVWVDYNYFKNNKDIATINDILNKGIGIVIVKDNINVKEANELLEINTAAIDIKIVDENTQVVRGIKIDKEDDKYLYTLVCQSKELDDTKLNDALIAGTNSQAAKNDYINYQNQQSSSNMQASFTEPDISGNMTLYDIGASSFYGSDGTSVEVSGRTFRYNSNPVSGKYVYCNVGTYYAHANTANQTRTKTITTYLDTASYSTISGYGPLTTSTGTTTFSVNLSSPVAVGYQYTCNVEQKTSKLSGGMGTYYVNLSTSPVGPVGTAYPTFSDVIVCPGIEYYNTYNKAQGSFSFTYTNNFGSSYSNGIALYPDGI